jgi:hypothetical protein
MQYGRARASVAALGLAGAVIVALASPLGVTARGISAHSARRLNGTAIAHLHLIRAEGSQLIEEGPVSGELSGYARANFQTGAQFSGTVTIHTHGGAITGRGRATPHGSSRYQSFSGSFTAASGTGRYSHISGRAGLYGVFDRRSDSVVIQTTGSFAF